MAEIAMVAMCGRCVALGVLILPSLSWAWQLPTVKPVSALQIVLIASRHSRQVVVCRASEGEPSRRNAVGQQGLLFLLPSLAVVSPLGMGMATAATAEEKEAAIQSALDLLRVESESGKNVAKLDTALTAQDWDTLNKYSREYDAYLRGELMGKAKKAMADKKAAQSIREQTMYALIGVSKGARSQDGEMVGQSLALVKQLLAQFLALERAPPSA